MSLYDYQQSVELAKVSEWPFYSLIMAAMKQADSDNEEKLQMCWPEVWAELDRRYHAPGGVLPEDA